jgi:small subunit ribosomal protein S8
MALTDPIADMLTAIKNASFVRKEVVEVKNSKLNESIMRILKDEKFISNYKVIKDDRQGILRVYLRYGRDEMPAITGIRKITKPSRRVYKSKEDLPAVYGGLGVAIISTSKGVVTDKEARRLGVGGEVLCYVW